MLLGAAYRSGGPGYLLVQIDTGTGAVEDVGPSVVRPSGLAFTAIVETPLGDVNLDGVTDFLDIGPFRVLSAGTYQVEADIDQSGAVDFLDIAPMIAILSAS